MDKGFFDYLKELLQAINWPVAVLLIGLLLRRQLAALFAAMARKVDRPGEVAVTKDGISIKEYVDKKVEEKQNETLSMLEAGVGKKQPEARKIATIQAAREMTTAKGTDVPDNDPLKRTWENIPAKENKNRRIRAAVTPISNTKLYKIKLYVESTSKADPLKGKVWFHLHPSFAEPNPVVDVVDGKAELNLVAYGSFTVGVETDDRQRKIKLDLAEDVPGVSEEFKNT